MKKSKVLLPTCLFVAMATVGCGDEQPAKAVQAAPNAEAAAPVGAASALASEAKAQDVACARLAEGYSKSAPPTTSSASDNSAWVAVVVGPQCSTGWMSRDGLALDGGATPIFAASDGSGAQIGTYFPGLGGVSSATVELVGADAIARHAAAK